MLEGLIAVGFIFGYLIVAVFTLTKFLIRLTKKTIAFKPSSIIPKKEDKLSPREMLLNMVLLRIAKNPQHYKVPSFSNKEIIWEDDDGISVETQNIYSTDFSRLRVGDERWLRADLPEKSVKKADEVLKTLKETHEAIEKEKTEQRKERKALDTIEKYFTAQSSE